MKVNLILFSLFLLVSIMACNVFAFSISGGVDWPPESPDNQYHLNK